MTIGKYRDHACDVFFKSFVLIKRVFKDEGQQFFFKLLLEAVENQ